MGIIVGSARIDENGKIAGGSAGDQTGQEVSTQNYYVHSKGWYVLRPKLIEDANKIAEAMQQACDNNNIGYDQNNRLGVITQLSKYGSLKKIAVKTESDCSSLVRACCIQTGFDPGNFTTSNEATVLENTNRFEKRVTVTSSTVLYNGDVLVTKSKGHTVVVVSGNPRKSLKSIEEVAKDVIKGLYGSGEVRKQKLETEGYNYDEVQAEVNRQLKGSTTTPTTPTSKPKDTTTTKVSPSLKLTANVKGVQTWLNTYYNAGLKVDGSYGKKTKRALVRAWQTEVGGLEVDGDFGAKSKAKASSHNIKKGSKGILVTIWQAYLVCRGYSIGDIDGSFGLKTYTATLAFQKANGLTRDGVVGKGTWSKAFS